MISCYNWKSCLVYLDDVIIFSKYLEFHFKEVESIFPTMRSFVISLKLNKYEFFTTSVKFLGHIIKPEKLSIKDAHIKILRLIQQPKTLTKLW